MDLLLSRVLPESGRSGHCGHSAYSLGKCTCLDPTGSQTHPGSPVCQEGLLLGHAKASGGKAGSQHLAPASENDGASEADGGCLVSGFLHRAAEPPQGRVMEEAYSVPTGDKNRGLAPPHTSPTHLRPSVVRQAKGSRPLGSFGVSPFWKLRPRARFAHQPQPPT